MNQRKLWLLAGAVLAAFAFVAPGSARVHGPVSASASEAGTLVFGAEQGGGADWCLNRILAVDCGEFWNGMFETPVIRGAFLFTPKFRYRPDLISRYTLKLRPMRVTYYIRKNAKWSDGIQVTGKDWRFTWQTVIDRKNATHVVSLGWEDIRSVKGNGKVVTVTFNHNVAAWKDLFGYVLPAHALAGTDILRVWDDCICNPKNGNAPISDGPFLLTRFDRGSGITLTKNRRGWYGKPAKLNSIVFRFLASTSSEILSMRSRELDAIYPSPQPGLDSLRHQAGLTVVSHLGLGFEQISIQEGSKGNPLAKQRWLRQALITGLNRSAAARALYGALNPNVKVLNSVSRLTNEPGYNPKHFSRWNYNPNKVESMMRAHNCSKGSDGIFRCAGTKVSFELASTAGNTLRQLAFTIFQDQAAKAGIELRYGFLPSGTFFNNVEALDFDLAMFAFAVDVDPHYVVEVFSCDPLSLTGYCNRTVNDLLARSDRELNDKKRLALVNRAGAIIGNDVPLIPLFQRPTYLVYSSSVHGMVDNPSSQGPSYNAEDWSKG